MQVPEGAFPPQGVLRGRLWALTSGPTVVADISCVLLTEQDLVQVLQTLDKIGLMTILTPSSSWEE